MKTESQRVKIEGHLLHRLIMHPDDGVPVRAAALFYHGQGDYAERYPEVLESFVNAGIRCVVTDLLGHGHSPGRRGHSGDERLLDGLVRNTLGSFEGLPYLVMGHSMGGLLALRHLVKSSQGHYAKPLAAWVNAPLLRPSHGRSVFFLKMVKLAASWFPSRTISTGVTSQMCRVIDEEGEEKVQTKPRHPLWHRRISLGWGSVLMEFEKLVWKHEQAIDEDIPILMTQGGQDPVCPPEFARFFFEKLPQGNKIYKEFPERLHELFSDDGNEELSKVIQAWLWQGEGELFQ